MAQVEQHRAVRTVIDRTPARPVAAEGFVYPRTQALALARELKRAIEGEVRFDDGDRALWATDASNYRQTPIGVVLPKSAADAVAVMKLCARYDAPVTPRGGGTSLAGQTCNTAVIIDFSKYMNRILRIEPGARLADVEPGCVLDSLRDAAEAHQLTFPPDPATHSRNTLGGMIGNDSCGVHSIMTGRTADNLQALDIVTYEGLRMTVGETSADEYRRILAQGGRKAEIYRGMRELWDRYGHLFAEVYPKIPRRVSGYENLDQLAWDKGFNVARALVGTEAGCVMVLGATVKLAPSPPCRVLALIGFPDIFRAADSVCDVLAHGPIGIEGIDRLLVDYEKLEHLDLEELKELPKGSGWLIVEFGGATTDEAVGKAEPLQRRYRAKGYDVSLLRTPAAQAKIWRVREDSLAATAHAPGVGDTFEGWEDSAVRREDLGRYLRALEALFRKYGYEAAVYGHFGDGVVHCRIDWDPRTEAGVAKWRAFLEEAAGLVVRYGGSLSGEHGDGQARGALLEKMYGPELMAAQRAFKALWDPRGRMNPGKVLDPYPITSNLRIGPKSGRPPIHGQFAYPDDHGDFARVAERCVGVGACRRLQPDGGVMCPSYMATHEERHSTRGRARLLFEMVRGETITDGWDSSAVEEALDLCLACKGCKSDCPVHVDMASYKAEFRSRHYAQRLRPRAAYALGQIRWWAEIADHAPALANFATRTPGLAAAAKMLAGVAQARAMPAFARQSFGKWWRARPKRPGDGPRVILWPDTFNDFFRPATAIAAVSVLEGLGFQVETPGVSLCCGRPLYDWGWLDQARALWRRTLNVLQADIEQGVEVVGLEPACVSAFRDELPALFPGDPLAAKLSAQTLFLTEFLRKHGLQPRIAAPRPALVHMHCHHHAVLDHAAETAVLRDAGLQFDLADAGCCGMAGAFGFEAGKQAVAMAIGEQKLLPAVRRAAGEKLILANGFSCREQIEQATGAPTWHVAELLAGCCA
jgi:FAD/FMN-containing dehydrogenase/Fe-S oxidoreductase